MDSFLNGRRRFQYKVSSLKSHMMVAGHCECCYEDRFTYRITNIVCRYGYLHHVVVNTVHVHINTIQYVKNVLDFMCLLTCILYA